MLRVFLALSTTHVACSASDATQNTKNQPEHKTEQLPESHIFDEQDAKCYKARYFDLNGATDAADHFSSIGQEQGRHFACGRKLTDFETQLYIDQNPEVRRLYGSGSSAYSRAREHYSRVGRHDIRFSQLRDQLDQPYFCSGEDELCQCNGMIWIGSSNRPDTAEKITSFDEFLLFQTGKFDGEDELLTCDPASFSTDFADKGKKQCFCEPRPDPEPYRCANQGEDCQCPNGIVIYGPRNSQVNKGQWARYDEVMQQSWIAAINSNRTSVSCDGRSFDNIDPADGQPKQCFCDPTQHALSPEEIDIQKEYFIQTISLRTAQSVLTQTHRELVKVERQKTQTVERIETSHSHVNEHGEKCVEHCQRKQARSEAELKITNIKEKYSTLEQTVKTEIHTLILARDKAEEKKKSVMEMISKSNAQKDQVEQLKLKQNSEAILDDAAQESAKASEQLLEKQKELEDLKHKEKAELDSTESSKQISIVESKKQAKLTEARTQKSKAELKEKESSEEKHVLQDEIEAETKQGEAITLVEASLKKELELVEKQIKMNLNKTHAIESEAELIDGGEALESQKQTEIKDSISKLEEKIASEKKLAAQEISQANSALAQTEGEIEQLEVEKAQKQKDLTSAKVDRNTHKIRKAEAEIALESDPSNHTADTLLHQMVEQMKTDEELINQIDSSLQKDVGKVSQLQQKAADLKNKTQVIADKAQLSELELTGEITLKEERKVKQEERKRIDEAIQKKEKAMDTFVQAETQKEVIAQAKTDLSNAHKENEKSKKKHEKAIAKDQAEVKKLEKELEAANKKKPTDYGTDKIKQLQEEINSKQRDVGLQKELLNTEAKEEEDLKNKVQQEEFKEKELQDKVKAEEQDYNNTISNATKQDNAELIQLKEKAQQAKQAAASATKQASETQNKFMKQHDTADDKMKTCEAKIGEAHTRIKILVQRKGTLRAMIKKAPSQQIREDLSLQLTNVTADITAQKQAISNFTSCVQEAVTTKVQALQEIFTAVNSASEAVLLANQAESEYEIVRQDIEQAQHVKSQVEADLKKEVEQGTSKLRELEHEKQQLTSERKHEKAIAKDLEREQSQKTVDLKNVEKQLEDMQNKLQQFNIIKDKATGQEKVQIEYSINEIIMNIPCTAERKKTYMQLLFKTKKQLDTAKRTIKQLEQRNVTANEFINQVKTELAQNVSIQSYQHTMLEVDESKAETEIRKIESQQHHLDQEIDHHHKEEAEVQQELKTHTEQVAEATTVLNQLEAELEVAKETIKAEPTPDPITSSNIQAIEEQVKETTQRVEQEKAAVATSQAKVDKIENEVKQLSQEKVRAQVARIGQEKKLEDVARENKTVTIRNVQKEQRTRDLKVKEEQAREVVAETQQELQAATEEAQEQEEEVKTLTSEKEQAQKQKAELEGQQRSLERQLRNPYTAPYNRPRIQEKLDSVEQEVEAKTDDLVTIEAKREIAIQHKNNNTKQILEVQAKLTNATAEVKRVETQEQQINKVVAQAYKAPIERLVKQETKVKQEVARQEQKKEELKQEIQQAEEKKHEVETAAQNSQTELKKVEHTAEVAKQDETLSSCQNIYYSLPEAQRRVFFDFGKDSNSYSGPLMTSSGRAKCPNQKEYSQEYKVRIRTTKDHRKAVKEQLNKLIEADLVAEYSVLSKPTVYRRNGRAEPTKDKKDNVVLIEVTLSSPEIGMCEIQDMITERMGSSSTSLFSFVVSSDSIEQKAVFHQ